MANVEDEHTSATGRGAGMLDRDDRPERPERPDRGSLKVRPREDDEQIDPTEYAQLLDVYDNSFRNIAEGEVVKGQVTIHVYVDGGGCRIRCIVDHLQARLADGRQRQNRSVGKGSIQSESRAVLVGCRI